MTQRSEEPRKRFKLRVSFVGTDIYDNDDSVLPYRKLIYLAYSDERVGEVRRKIESMFASMNPEDGLRQISRLRDSYMCDVSDEFLVSDVFDESPVVYAAMDALAVYENDDTVSVAPNSTGYTESPSTSHMQSSGGSKRKRYMLTQQQTPLGQNPSKSFVVTPSLAASGYSTDDQEGYPGPKKVRRINNNASIYVVKGPESVSPEFSPYMARNNSILGGEAANMLPDAQGQIANGRDLRSQVTAPSSPEIWGNRGLTPLTPSLQLSSHTEPNGSAVQAPMGNGSIHAQVLTEGSQQTQTSISGTNVPIQTARRVSQELSTEAASAAEISEMQSAPVSKSVAANPPASNTRAKSKRRPVGDVEEELFTETAGAAEVSEIPSTPVSKRAFTDPPASNTRARSKRRPIEDVEEEEEENQKQASVPNGKTTTPSKSQQDTNNAESTVSGRTANKRATIVVTRRKSPAPTIPAAQAPTKKQQIKATSPSKADLIESKAKAQLSLAEEASGSESGSGSESSSGSGSESESGSESGSSSEESNALEEQSTPNPDQFAKGIAQKDDETKEAASPAKSKINAPGTQETVAKSPARPPPVSSSLASAPQHKTSDEAPSASLVDMSAEEGEESEESSGEEGSSNQESSSSESDEGSSSEEEASEEKAKTGLKDKSSTEVNSSKPKDGVSKAAETKTMVGPVKAKASAKSMRAESESEKEDESESGSDSEEGSGSESGSDSGSGSEEDSESDTGSEYSDYSSPDTEVTKAQKPKGAEKPKPTLKVVTNPPSTPVKVKLSDDKIEELPKSPLTLSRRKVQLRKTPAEVPPSDSSDSDSDNSTSPRRLTKIPVLGTPDATTRSSGNDLHKMLLAQKNKPGIVSISEIASSKPYDSLRKSLAKAASTKVTSNLQNTPNTSDPTCPKKPARTVSADESSESDSDSGSDSGSNSDMSDFAMGETKAGNNNGNDQRMSGARAAAAGGRKMPIRFAGTKSLSDSAKARRRKSALLSL
ncbi:hypothetical protein EV178_003801 [Coemansia sp. RSA 1646]|nr:hypothetical protein EV178_003801 [Coemansia sp. RSA 1646]KAJ2091425.1 hypothetical protein IW138_001884 [Coemansia sp. RSA 986]